MRLAFIPLILGLLVAGCAEGPIASRAVVSGAGSELLKLRAGPGLGYRIILGLPDGTVVNRHSCVVEVGQRWCRVSLAAAPGMRGFVADDYLTPR